MAGDSLNITDDVRQKIIEWGKACERSGREKMKEYAVAVSLATGEPIEGCDIIEGTDHKVYVKRWNTSVDRCSPNSLAVIHNHTNGTPFSFVDEDSVLRFFHRHSSVGVMLLVTGNRMLYIGKADMVAEFDAIVNAVRCEFKKLSASCKYKGVELADETYRRALPSVGIIFENWGEVNVL